MVHTRHISVKLNKRAIISPSLIVRLAARFVLLIAALPAIDTPTQAQDPGRSPPSSNDPTTLSKKVLCGYQGWFRCPGDPAGEGWRHWSRRGDSISPSTLTFDMWPDTSELTKGEKYPAPGFTMDDQTQAHLFSSAHPQTVDRHFQWMKHYGIDGVFLQRFLVNVGNPSFDLVLNHVRASAKNHGRVYAITYDLTGADPDRLVDILARDWKHLTQNLAVTADDRYLHHSGRPVLFIWGFYPDRFGATLAHQIIDIFKSDPHHKVTLIGGCPWYWRQEQDPEWSRAFRRFDVISPWNVGNVTHRDGQEWATTNYWQGDIEETRKHGIAYLPVLYPGFSWINLKGPSARRESIPRLGGQFLWKQFTTAAELRIDMAYVAMFDEVDEATAIFKVTNNPPSQANFVTYEGLSSDHYLRLTGEGARLLRGESRLGLDLPIQPWNSDE